MNEYLVIATFKDGVTPEEIRALIPAEQIRAKELNDQGLVGFIKVAMPKKKVFIEAFGENEENVLKSIKSLPLAALWELEVFETTPPAGSKF